MATAKKTTEEIVEEPVEQIGEKRVTIFIPRDKENGESSVFVAVNDRTFLIKRGENVEVPECVAEVIAESERLADLAFDRREAAQKS